MPPSARTRPANRVSSAVLPMPASPVTRTSPAQPETVPPGGGGEGLVGGGQPGQRLGTADEREHIRILPRATGGRSKVLAGFWRKPPAALARTWYHRVLRWHSGRHRDRHIRSAAVQDHHPRAMGGRRRGLAPVGSGHRGLARCRHRADARRRQDHHRQPRARRGRRCRRAEPGRSTPGRPDRARPGHRHLPGHPGVRREGGQRRRAEHHHDPRARRRTPRRR